MAKLYGRNYIGDILSDGQALPQNTNADSTNMADISGGETNNGLSVFIYAESITKGLDDGETLTINLQTYSSDSAADAEAPFSFANSSGFYGATGTSMHATANTLAADAGVFGITLTAGSADITWEEGDLIAEIPIPEVMMRLLGHTHVQLHYITDDAAIDMAVTAFVAPRI